MKIFIVAVSFFLPLVAFASGEDGSPSLFPGTFAGSYTLLIVLIIAFLASGFTLNYAFKMLGSTVGGILLIFGFGMLAVACGILSVVLPWNEITIQKFVHDILFIVGYSLMLLGVLRVRKLHA